MQLNVTRVTFQDNTRYSVVKHTHGGETLVRDPKKVNGRDRKWARKVTRRRLGKRA